MFGCSRGRATAKGQRRRPTPTADSDELIDGMPMKPWLPAEFDEEDRGKAPVTGDNPRDQWYRTAGNKTEFLGLENAVKVVTSEEGSGPVSVNLYLHRGLTKTLK